jgi:hypothetical protein
METVFKTHEVSIDYFTGDELYLIPFGDVHRDTDSCDIDRWKWFHESCKKYPQDKTYYLGMGDFNDFASSSEFRNIQKTEIHDQTRMKFDQMVQTDNRRFASEVSFMRGRFLGLLDGNHNWRFTDGKTAVEDLAERLDSPYLGWLTHITVKFKLHAKTGNSRNNEIHMYIVACHGKAGGKLAGTTINQVDDLKKIFPVADIYIMGHDHQRTAHPTAVLVPAMNHSGLKQKRQFLVRSGSFKKGYCDGVSGYEVGRLLRPSDLGTVVLPISIHRDVRETDRLILDIKAII